MKKYRERKTLNLTFQAGSDRSGALFEIAGDEKPGVCVKTTWATPGHGKV